MKMLKCHVAAFGKLKNFDIDFNDGLNVITQENGWGKTTLATFIKCMFYGIDGSKKKDISANERKKYRPWRTTEKFGGYIEFAWGDFRYRLERYFGNKESEDVVLLTDLKTGKVAENVLNLGKRIFEIDEEGFASTTYFSQKDLSVKPCVSLTEKFNDSANEFDSAAYKIALLKLEEEGKKYKKTGNKGKIYEAKQEIAVLEDELETSKIAQKLLLQKRAECVKAEAELEQLNSRLKKLTSEMEKASGAEAIRVKRERYEECRNEVFRITANLEKCEKFLNGHYPSEEVLKAYSICAEDITKNNEKIAALSKNVEEMERLLSALPKKKKSTKKAWIYSLSAAVVPLIVAVLSLVLQWSAAITATLFFATAALIILGLVAKFYQPKNTDNSLTEYKELLEKNKNELEQYKAINHAYSEKLDDFLSMFAFEVKCDYKTALSIISQNVDDYKELSKTFAEKNALLENYSKDKDVFSEVNTVNLNKDVIAAELSESRREFAEKAHDLAGLKISVSQLEIKAASTSDIENKLNETKELLSKYLSNYEILIKTAETLKIADETLKSKYKLPLEEAVNKYAELIDEKYKGRLYVDVDMNVAFEEGGATNSSEYLSAGYDDLINICKRFALIDILFKREKPFVIMDDPLCNLDEEKIERALSLIEKLSLKYQIIYFTCHKSRSLIKDESIFYKSVADCADGESQQ